MDLTAWQQDVEFWFKTHEYSGDASHDIAHFRRVWRTARQIAEGQPVDLLVILLASYFHDLVSLPKNHPDRARSSQLAAQQTLEILQRDFPHFPPERYDAVAHAIAAHSFRARIPPQTEEARIVQDADGLRRWAPLGWHACLPSRVR